ncbi:hypothetical protein ACFWG0_28290 [Streptomyces yangpuensis]|uniref:hypothetical protein n=1 Tax=Streptomyces yangpuensis TaxID=1648182 RepID=UPI003650561C
MVTLTDWLSVGAAVASAVTAGITLRISGRATQAAVQSSKAAERANAVADAVARVERARWHFEMRPQFDVTVTRTSYANTALLLLTYKGPLERG